MTINTFLELLSAISNNLTKMTANWRSRKGIESDITSEISINGRIANGIHVFAHSYSW
jgi:hypothetical protein